MARVSTGEIEKYYFEQFRNHFVLPEGDIVYADKPDVRIQGNSTIGVEITNLYIADGSDPNSEQIQSGRREQVLVEAQKIYSEAGGRSIELNVDFDPLSPIINIGRSARKLAELAKGMETRPTTLSGHLAGNAEGFRFVHHNGIEYTDAKWRNIQSYTVPPLDTVRLQAVIEEKTRKSEGYEKCDEYWLLVVVDFMNLAQDQELTLPSDFGIPNHVFKRVLVYKPQFGQVVEVPQ